MIDHKQMRYVHGISRKPLPEGRVLVHNQSSHSHGSE
jgi:hypothetical protein